MEIKINTEIKDYNETMFFGLSVRQFIFALLACGAAVGIYFGCRPFLHTEVLSWLCMLGAAPFAALGFVKYNGMTAEQMQNVMRPHPTFNEGVTEAFEDVTGQSIHSAPPKK